jgi:hypothetical protein
MGFINEAMNDFYKKQTFYSSAKSYKPELKKQIIAFFRKKGLSGYKADYSQYANFEYDNLKNMDQKTKRKQFHLVVGEIKIKSKFFSVYQT